MRATAIVGNTAAERARQERAKQGLPPAITDAATLQRIAALVAEHHVLTARRSEGPRAQRTPEEAA